MFCCTQHTQTIHFPLNFATDGRWGLYRDLDSASFCYCRSFHYNKLPEEKRQFFFLLWHDKRKVIMLIKSKTIHTPHCSIEFLFVYGDIFSTHLNPSYWNRTHTVTHLLTHTQTGVQYIGILSVIETLIHWINIQTICGLTWPRFRVNIVPKQAGSWYFVHWRNHFHVKSVKTAWTFVS